MEVQPNNHFYFIFDNNPIAGSITEASIILTRYYLNSIKQSDCKWKKDLKAYTINWINYSGEQMTSKPISYLIFAQQLRELGEFVPQSFNLPKIECFWLDRLIDLKIDFHMRDPHKNEALTMVDGTPQKLFGPHYPIKPKLDREGRLFTTLQPLLITRIIELRKNLILNSNNALEYNWLMDLRTLINEVFSLVDITLNQFYIKAKFDPLPGWIFDQVRVGEPHNKRLLDKLKWVKQITGRELNYEPERASLVRLKEVRNHFNHFNPPSLVITLEEAEVWLNDIIILGYLLIRIRKTMGVEVSTELLNLIIQRKATFVPRDAFKNRIPLNSKVSGYYSSQW